MRIIICGAGQVGYGIAERLAAERNDVSVIDSSEALIQKIQDQLDVRGFVGHAPHPDILASAGAEQADMVIAVTLYDEVNMVICQIAHSLFEVPTKIARIRSQNYRKQQWKNLFSSNNMPIDVIISPEIEVGELILQRIALPDARDVVQFANKNISMIAIECGQDCPVVDTPLNQLSKLFPDLKATIVGLWRNEQLLVPKSRDDMQVGDIAYVIVEKTQVQRTLAIFGKDHSTVSKIVIIGGGNIGFYIAEKIESHYSSARIKLIESSRERAAYLAENFNRAIILHGNGLDESLLTEAGIVNSDLVVAVTNDDQVNILASVLAKRLGCKQNLILLNNAGYHSFTRSLGIDDFVNPRQVTISKILEHVRRGRICSVYSIQNGIAEILEAQALETSPLIGRPICELGLPNAIRIGAIYRDGMVIMPKGDLEIKSNDRIIILAGSDHVRHAEQMFRASLDFF